MSKLHSILSYPAAYLALQSMLGAPRARRICLNDYAHPRAGERVLDLGCGPGYILDYLPDVDFVGMDIDAHYVQFAQRRYGHRGRFLCQELNPVTASELQPFDLILCNGLLHHLSDAQIQQLLPILRSLLRSEGRLVTLDGCYVPKMSRISRFLLNHDRGQYVRTLESYQRLMTHHFASCQMFHRKDLFYVPYDALVMVCRT